MLNGDFILYLVAVGLFGIGFMDFPENVIEERFLPLLYALAMLADAVAALFRGWLYDRVKLISLLVACGVSAFCAVLLFRAEVCRRRSRMLPCPCGRGGMTGPPEAQNKIGMWMSRRRI